MMNKLLVRKKYKLQYIKSSHCLKSGTSYYVKHKTNKFQTRFNNSYDMYNQMFIYLEYNACWYTMS